MSTEKRYLPRAIAMNADGSEMELRTVERYDNLYYAYRQMKEWKEIYGGRIRDRRIEVYGEKRKLYDIHLTEGKKRA